MTPFQGTRAGLFPAADLPGYVTLPPHVRVISVVLGAFVAVLQVGSGLAQLTSEPIIAGSQLLVGVPFLALFAWVAAWPDHADRVIRGRFGIDLSDGSVLTGVLIHVVFIYLVFGGTLLSTGQALAEFIETDQHPALGSSLTGQGVVLNLVLNLVLFVVAAVTWLLLVTQERGREILGALRLRLDELPRGIVAGVLMTVVGVVVLAGLGYGLEQLGLSPENPQADAIANALTPMTAVAVAALAGLGEEIYFRGFLLPRTGNLVQATLFGLLHATYLTAFQVILPFLLGLAFGWLVRKTSLWAAIVSHTTFNAVMLLGSIYADELAEIVMSLPLP